MNNQIQIGGTHTYDSQLELLSLCRTVKNVTGQKITTSFIFWQWFRKHIIYFHEGYVRNNGKNPRPESKTLITQ